MAGRQVPWPCAIQGGRHELGRDLCARMGTPSAVVPVAASGPGGAVGGGGRGHVDDGHADRGAGAQCRLAPDTPHRRADRRLLPGRRHLGHALHRHACLRALHLRRLRPLDHRAVHAAQHAGVLAGADADGAAPAVRPGAGRRRRAHGAGHWLHALHRHGGGPDLEPDALRPLGRAAVGDRGRHHGHAVAVGALSAGQHGPPVAHPGRRHSHGPGHFLHALCGPVRTAPQARYRCAGAAGGAHACAAGVLHRGRGGAGLRPGARGQHDAALPPDLPAGPAQRVAPARRGGYGGGRHRDDRRARQHRLVQRRGRAAAGLDGAGGAGPQRQPAHARVGLRW